MTLRLEIPLSSDFEKNVFVFLPSKNTLVSDDGELEPTEARALRGYICVCFAPLMKASVRLWRPVLCQQGERVFAHYPSTTRSISSPASSQLSGRSSKGGGRR
jgi:hypothetical protein